MSAQGWPLRAQESFSFGKRFSRSLNSLPHRLIKCADRLIEYPADEPETEVSHCGHNGSCEGQHMAEQATGLFCEAG